MWPGMMPILHAPGRDDAGAVRADRGATGLPSSQRRTRDHVHHRDALGDADDELAARVGRLEDRVGRAGRRDEDERGVGAASCDGLGHRVEDRDLALELLAAAPGRDAGDDLGAVLEHCCAWNEPAPPVMP